MDLCPFKKNLYEHRSQNRFQTTDRGLKTNFSIVSIPGHLEKQITTPSLPDFLPLSFSLPVFLPFFFPSLLFLFLLRTFSKYLSVFSVDQITNHMGCSKNFSHSPNSVVLSALYLKICPEISENFPKCKNSDYY